eukprot:CAMPEP_0206278104 /NCGR_PEP_ID=MMETSP0047_2-20121206/37235_1 /ASSEMBLY_ACC=CAM_ASM_000192 /TAXON_ID=195065 /ORGANISM="Chroomonas mesostigmatica_cf, Strain CCMP1168" /LENGTH=158 /DNA_ID=CAMNT_0053707813 /DNA_START=37 /DNA_END=513 /DNA_ORIENTATION=+
MKNKACRHTGCRSQASYGPKGGLKSSAMYCADHSQEGQVVRDRKPIFGDATERVARFCARHKLKGHCDVVHKPCQHEGCHLQPIFGAASSKTATFCKNHKGPADIDLLHRRCQYAEGCTRRAGPAFRKEFGLYLCGAHYKYCSSASSKMSTAAATHKA